MIACHIVLLLSKIHVNKEFIRADNNCEAVLTSGNKLIWTLHSLCQSLYNREILRESRDAIIRKRSKKGEVHPLTPTVRDVPSITKHTLTFKHFNRRKYNNFPVCNREFLTNMRGNNMGGEG